MSETSTKPYLLRALYEWCTDSGYTPYLAVRVDDSVQVPREYAKNGEIVLNVSALATSKLLMGNDYIEFQARFGGIARHIFFPVSHVSAIYAKETGHGMAFEVDLPDPPALASVDLAPAALPAPSNPVSAEEGKGGVPGIKLVHRAMDPAAVTPRPVRLRGKSDALPESGSREPRERAPDDPPGKGPTGKGPGGPSKGKPRLKIVK